MDRPAALTLEQARAEFAIAERLAYLQHGGQSPLPRSAARAVAEAARQVAEDDPARWVVNFMADRTALKEGLGRMLGVSAEDIAIVRATAHGLSLVASGLDWRAGDNVVGADREYPANQFPWMALAGRGVEYRRVGLEDGRVTLDGLRARMDGRTRVVALSFVQFWNGARADLDAIGAECRSRGVELVVDGIQGLGAVRMDAAACGAGLVTAGNYKWLMGAHGLGFAYIRPDLAERLRPALVGVGTAPDFGDELDPVYRPAGHSRRFEESAPSWLNIAAAKAGLDIIEGFGFDAAERRITGQVLRLGEMLTEVGCRVTDPWPRAQSETSGLLSFRVPGVEAAAVVARLAEAGVMCRAINDMVRFCVHFWNTEEEVDHAVAVVAGLVER